MDKWEGEESRYQNWTISKYPLDIKQAQSAHTKIAHIANINHALIMHQTRTKASLCNESIGLSQMVQCIVY